jgi:hypothetical protein
MIIKTDNVGFRTRCSGPALTEWVNMWLSAPVITPNNPSKGIFDVRSGPGPLYAIGRTLVPSYGMREDVRDIPKTPHGRKKAFRKVTCIFKPL